MGSEDNFECSWITGRLELIIGNMFSGKSSELIRRINRERSINKKILVINYLGDNRYSKDSVTTHDLTKVKCLKLDKLLSLNENIINGYDSFFIDEAQFFPDLYTFVKMVVEKCNKHVVVSGLDGDSNRNSFGDIIKLIPISDTVDKLTAYCIRCNNGTLGPFTKKISTSESVVDIGGIDKYLPVCRKHYLF